MKFSSRLDAQRFCTDIGALDLVPNVDQTFVPSQEQIDEFVKRRHDLVRRLRDFSRSQSSKGAWRKFRHKFQQGIDRFQRSSQGKRFHREMGRFLATCMAHDKSKDRKTDRDSNAARLATESMSIHESAAILKALSSVKTHAFIPLEFYQSVDEEVSWWMFLEEFLPVLASVESKILNDQMDRIDETELETLLRIVDPKMLTLRFCEAMGCLTPEEIERLWGKEKGSNPMEGNIGAVNGKYIRMFEQASSQAKKKVGQDEDAMLMTMTVEGYMRMLEQDKASADSSSRPRKLDKPVQKHA